MPRFLLLCLLLAGGLLAACAPSDTPETTPPADPALLPGYNVYVQRCRACHWVTPQDEVGKGPSLAGLAGRAGERVAGVDARAYVRQSIVDPGAYIVPGYPNNMPDNYAARLTPAEIEAVIDYLLSLE